MNVLLIEDEASLADALTHILKKEKYNVDTVNDGERGFEHGVTGRYDIIILDVMLPRMNGFDVLKKLRAEKVPTPILMLTARAQVSDRVYGLDLGADDYLGKPFFTPELLARIRALLRRKTDVINENVMLFSDLELNISSFELICREKRVKISLKESEILQYLFNRINFVVTKDELIIKIWGYDAEAEYNNVEVYISFLRKKMQFLGSKATIVTVRGAGYKLEDNA
jgi:DNA-binding response OmpR family regulator